MEQTEAICKVIEKPFDKILYPVRGYDAGRDHMSSTRHSTNGDGSEGFDDYEDETDINISPCSIGLSCTDREGHEEREQEVRDLATMLTQTRISTECALSENETVDALSTWLEALDVHETQAAVLAPERQARLSALWMK